VLGLRRRADRRPPAVRHRTRGRDPRRRDDRARAARPEPDGGLRPLELVAAGAARARRARGAVAARGAGAAGAPSRRALAARPPAWPFPRCPALPNTVRSAPWA